MDGRTQKGMKTYFEIYYMISLDIVISYTAMLLCCYPSQTAIHNFMAFEPRYSENHIEFSHTATVK